MSFQCPSCGAISHNRNDERERYCGACHTFVVPLHFQPRERALGFMRFLNALKILRSIDEHEFDGFEIDYPHFRDDPYYFLMSCDDATAAKIWEIVESRQPEDI